MTPFSINISEECASASIKIVDSATGNPIKGACLSLEGGEIDWWDKFIWDTTEYPVLEMDNLKEDSYSVYVRQLPSEYKVSSAESSFILKKGEHKDIVIEAECIAPVSTVSSDLQVVMGGDVNCDDQVDMADVVLIMQALANPNKYGENGTAVNHLTAQGKINGDMDGNGLTVGDAQAIQKILLGLE